MTERRTYKNGNTNRKHEYRKSRGGDIMNTVILYIFLIIILFIFLIVLKKKANERIEAQYYDENFTPTEIISSKDLLIRYMEVDTVNKKWRVNKQAYGDDTPIYEYNDLRDFELIEKSNGSYTDASTAPSMLGVLLDVPTATNTYAKTAENVNLIIRISFKDLSVADQYISFNNSTKGSLGYNMTFEKMEKCMSLLRKIKAYNEGNNIINENKNNSFVADELTKLKSLLDTGVITQEEFDTQKQKLL